MLHRVTQRQSWTLPETAIKVSRSFSSRAVSQWNCVPEVRHERRKTSTPLCEPTPPILPNTSTRRCEIKIAYRNKPVVTVPFEIASVEASMGDDVDHVPALSLAHVGIEGPTTVACIAVRWQIAQKLHACTEQPVDRVNDRFRDLLDLQLLGELVSDNGWRDARLACIEVFAGRAKHAWPPTVTIPEPWHAGYRAMADDIGFHVTDVAHAAAAVRQLITRIDSATDR